MADARTIQVSEDVTFAARCNFIALRFAVNVVASEAGTVVDHANRLALAQRMITGRIPRTLWAQVCLTSPAIETTAIGDMANSAAAVLDADIDARVQTFWNAVADAMVGAP
jgi:hypothetical protein